MRHVSFTGLLVFVSVSSFLYFVLNSIDRSMRLRRLPGTRATSVKGTLPFGESPPVIIADDVHIGTWNTYMLISSFRARHRQGPGECYHEPQEPGDVDQAPGR